MDVLNYVGYNSLWRLIQYKNYTKRYFKVINENGYEFELIVTVIQTWKDKFKYRIEDTIRILP